MQKMWTLKSEPRRIWGRPTDQTLYSRILQCGCCVLSENVLKLDVK